LEFLQETKALIIIYLTIAIFWNLNEMV
jgi:hypothetical protein